VNVLVTGVGGYVGSLVAARLHADGHAVRGFARRPERVALGVPVVGGDAVTGEGLAEAMDGVAVAYFLIHSMETAGADRFTVREYEAASRFAQAARTAGVRRIVYLGGPLPPGSPSDHLSSRLAVERVLLEAVEDSIALRASIVIGARSRSFRFLVRLVERLPVMAIPAWGDNRSAPIDERDVVAMLVRCAGVELAPAGADGGPGHVLDAAGPDVVSYRELIARIAELMIVDRPTVGLGRLTLTPIASRVAAAIAGEDLGLVAPLMDSLGTDLLPTEPDAATVLTVRLHSLDAAIERALREWEDLGTLAAR
jgi:uncharacterized protein YbjT (DUF2867 family)